MVLDQTGALANMTRHDYLPFGEELFAPTAGRSTAQGYAGDGVRQQFTLKERDVETGLDYFLARYYSYIPASTTSDVLATSVDLKARITSLLGGPCAGREQRSEVFLSLHNSQFRSCAS